MATEYSDCLFFLFACDSTTALKYKREKQNAIL